MHYYINNNKCFLLQNSNHRKWKIKIYKHQKYNSFSFFFFAKKNSHIVCVSHHPLWIYANVLIKNRMNILSFFCCCCYCCHIGLRPENKLKDSYTHHFMIWDPATKKRVQKWWTSWKHYQTDSSWIDINHKRKRKIRNRITEHKIIIK